MDKFEKILEIPACYISRELTERLALKIYAIAKEQENADYEQALRQMAPHFGLTPDQSVNTHRGNALLRTVLGLRKDRTIFISPYGNAQYGGRDVLYDEVPIDLHQVIIDVPGINGRYLNISLTSDVMQTFPLHKANKILVQGADQAWVDALYGDFKHSFDVSRKVLRDFLYRWLRFFGFSSLVLLSLLELKIFQLFHPAFTIQTPLTGLSVLMIFVLLLANQYLVFSVAGRAMMYLYPYFELEDRLSEWRKDCRKWWKATIAALYAGGIWAGFTLIWS